MSDILDPIFGWLDSFSALALILAIIAVLYLIRMLWRGAKKAWPGLKAFIAFVEALFQLPTFMEDITKSVQEVRHEVLPNNGGSMRDDLETVTLMLEEQRTRMKTVEDHDKKDNERIKYLEDTITRRRERREQAHTDDLQIPPFPQDIGE